MRCLLPSPRRLITGRVWVRRNRRRAGSRVRRHPGLSRTCVFSICLTLAATRTLVRTREEGFPLSSSAFAAHKVTTDHPPARAALSSSPPGSAYYGREDLLVQILVGV